MPKANYLCFTYKTPLCMVFNTAKCERYVPIAF